MARYADKHKRLNSCRIPIQQSTAHTKWGQRLHYFQQHWRQQKHRPNYCQHSTTQNSERLGNLVSGQLLGPQHHPIHNRTRQRLKISCTHPGTKVHSAKTQNKQFPDEIGSTGNGKSLTTHKPEDTGDLDSTLSKRATSGSDIEKTIDEFYEDPTTTCNESFRTQLTNKKATKKRSVPWWTDELTIMRKRVTLYDEDTKQRQTMRNSEPNLKHNI